MTTASIDIGHVQPTPDDRRRAVYERALARILRYLRPRRTSTLHDLSERQLRDIGVEPAVMAGIVEMRALDSFRGPEGRNWVLLMHRGPGS